VLVRAGDKHPLLVTDEGLRDAPMVRAAIALVPAPACSPACAAIRSPRTSTPGLAAYRKGGHDGVIAFGGGSALDAGKVIAFMSGPDAAAVGFRRRRRLVDARR
jgi:alcohol dehydrogenase class IV